MDLQYSRMVGARKPVEILMVLGIFACGDDGGPAPDAAIDASRIDAMVFDAPVVDAMPDGMPDGMIDATLPDAMPPDATPPDATPPDSDLTTTVMLAPIDDATLCNPTGAIGAGDLFVGTTNEPTSRRALLRFDVSGVPAGATIVTAELQVIVASMMGGRAVSLHLVTTDWNEGTSTPTGQSGGICGTAASDDATWADTGLGGSWTTAGGDFVALASATSADIAATSLTSAQMVADIDGWVATPGDNLGWILVHALEGTAGNVVKLTAASTRLVIRYLP